MNENFIGDTGAATLAELSKAPNLKDMVLGLKKNDIDSAGAAALAQFGNSPNLQRCEAAGQSL